MVQAVEQFAAKEIELYGRWQSKAAELAEAERVAGEAYNTDDVAAGMHVVRLRAEVVAIDGAIGAVRKRRSETITAKFRDQAQVARATSAAKLAELARLTEKSALLCKQLAELEGIDGGKFQPQSGSELRSSVLAREIREHDRLARSLDAAQISDHGLFDSGGGGVVTDSAVLLAVLSHESLAPSCAALRQWLEAVEADAAARNESTDFEHRPRRVRIEWKDGAINPASSYIFVPSAARLQDSRSEERGVDVGTATFHATPVGSPRRNSVDADDV